MHTVELLEQALELAERLGYCTRQEWIGGAGGGACEFGGRRWLFVDLALNAVERLQQVVDAVKVDPAIHTVDIPPALRKLLSVRQSA